VNAEPFGQTPQPVPLDLLDLPPGLTHLELRNIDVTSQPAEFAEANTAPASAVASEAAAQPAVAARLVPQCCPMRSYHSQLGGLQQGGFNSRPTSGGSGSSGSAAGGWSEHSCQDRSSSISGDRGSSRGVLRRLESFKLESCRLRAAQLQVRRPAVQDRQISKMDARHSCSGLFDWHGLLAV
jgi:hypothetical protein